LDSSVYSLDRGTTMEDLLVKRNSQMTANEFNAECVSRTIDPSIALENDDIQAALCQRNDGEVIRLLNEEF
jgi:hypothetical protein